MDSARTFVLFGPRVAHAISLSPGDDVEATDRRPPSTGLTEVQLRKIMREELARERDLQSFAGASEMMTMGELGAFLGKGRTALYEHRRRRDLADPMRKDAEFPPEYLIGKGNRPHWKKSEVVKWQSRNKR